MKIPIEVEIEVKNFFNSEKVITLKGVKYSEQELALLGLKHYTLTALTQYLGCARSTLKTKRPFNRLKSSTAPIGRRIASFIGSFTSCSGCRQYKLLKEFYRTNINDECRECYAIRRKTRPNYPKDKNKHKQHEAKRRAGKLKRTPQWANLERIKEIYDNCPIGYHVDHIVPLQGLYVSGLHVETNLQYLTPEENLRKSNTFQAD